MMLIFLRLKFGKIDPRILFLYMTKFKSNSDIFLLFLKAYFNNKNQIDILDHFFLLDTNSSETYNFKYKIIDDYLNYSDLAWKETILYYISFISPKLKCIEFSLVFEYIKTIINIKKYENNNKNIKDLICSFKYIFLGISLEQNNYIFDLIIYCFFAHNKTLTFFSFLDIDIG